MKIPTEKQFLLALKALSAPLPDELLDDCVRRLLLSRSDEEAAAMLVELVSAHNNLTCAGTESVAVKWLEQQNRFREVRHRAFRLQDGFAENALSDLDRAKRIWAEVQQTSWIFVDGLSMRVRKRAVYDEELMEDLRWNIQAHFDRQVEGPVRWLIIVLAAFLEYFYKPETVAEYLAHQKRVSSLVKEIEKGLRAQRELFGAPIYGDDFWFAKATQMADETHSVRLAQMDIQREVERAKMGTLPIRRHDNTSRERLLVYRLWLGNQLVFGESKQACIASLLTLQGVDYLSEESIKKCIAGFDRSYVERGAQNYRSLLANTRRSILGR